MLCGNRRVALQRPPHELLLKSRQTERPAGADRASFVSQRVAEVERETEEWRRLRWSMCEAERSPGENALDARCEQGLDAIKKRKAELLAGLKAL